MTRNHKQPTTAHSIRCAIYTRKSTEEGLEKEFNSLDAQRESAEAYVTSQQHEGWQCLPDRYDDGGFTGGNMDRPALKRLLADIEADKIDAVVVYKVDRLSRSLLDFSLIIEVFDKQQIAFISVTQAFNTANSMGRLVLNVLLSFAQFEREIISERTRDKICAARRKGKWSGGHPILGYDVDPQRFKLIVNESEAARVRAIFELYLELEGLVPVVQELERRGWLNKQWTTRKGPQRGGKPFTKTSLHKLLTNITYLGKVRYKLEVHEGEHAGIVDAGVWQRVQALLRRNGRSGGASVRNKFGAMLKGLLHCAPCECAMTPSHTTRNGNKRYRYYTCTHAQKQGWNTCPSKSIPAGQIEEFVVGRIRCIGNDPDLLAETISAAQSQTRLRLKELETERHGLGGDIEKWSLMVRNLALEAAGAVNASTAIAQLADLQERIRHAEERLTEIRDEADSLDAAMLDHGEVAQALTEFDPIWESLTPHEQTRIVQLLVERVDYDGKTHKVSITFQPAGIQTLARELAAQHKELQA